MGVSPATLAAILQASSSFSPLSLSPALWLDASDTSTLLNASGTVAANNAGVYTWLDKSGNAWNFSHGTSALSVPLRKDNFLNGKTVLNTTNQSRLYSSFSWEEVTIFLVGMRNATPSAYPKFISATGYPFNDFFNFGTADDQYWYPRPLTDRGIPCYINGAVKAINQHPSPSYNNWFIYTIYEDFFSSGTLSLLANNLDVQGLIGGIAEVIIVKSTISDSSRQQVERYLGAKWGITVA